MISTILRKTLRINASRNFAGLRNPLRIKRTRIRNPWARLLLNRFPR